MSLEFQPQEPLDVTVLEQPLDMALEPDFGEPLSSGFVDRIRSAFSDRTEALKNGGKILLASAALAGCGTSAATSPSSHNSDPVAASTSLTPDQLAQLRSELAISTVTADCVTTVQAAGTGKIVNLGAPGSTAYGVKLTVNETAPLFGQPNPNNLPPRITSDAMETPLSNPNDPNAALTQLEASICEEPVLGATLANEFANMEVDGVKVVDLNEFLKPYAFDATPGDNNINDLAATYLPGLNNPNVDPNLVISQNQAYQLFAEKLITLIQKFQNDGRATHPTKLNYHLSAEGLTADLPEVSLNSAQYNADAIWLRLTKKTGGCFVEIGFNVLDQRPEETNLCVTPPTNTTTTGPGATINIPTHPTTPNHPGTPNHPTTPTVPQNTTSTTFIGPKGNPHPPVGTNPPTTVPPAVPSGPTPTTSTTAPNNPNQPPSSTTTTIATPATTTTVPAGGCGAICNN